MVMQQSQPEGWDIVGHGHAITILRRMLTAQQVRHAYLFAGPPQIGKSLLAQRFAQTLLCTGGPDPHVAPCDPCNTCLSCRKVLHGNHPDVHVIARPADKQFILIEQVRALQNASARRTMEGRHNIFIILDAQDMNVQAANCLLKTLEEPEPGVVLILTAPDSGLLLPTIVSRVQPIMTHLLTTAQIKQALMTRWDVEEGEADMLAALSAGRLGWAVRAVEDDELLIERKEQLQMLAGLPALGKIQRFDLAQQASGDTVAVRDLLDLWLLWWRDIVLTTNNCLDMTVNVDMRDLLLAQARKITSHEAVRIVKAIMQTREAIDQNVNPRMALEVLMLDMPSVKL